MPEPADKSGDDLFRTLLNRAAVCGAFNPVEISRGIVPVNSTNSEAQTDTLLNRLAGFCDEIDVEGSFGWVLKTKKRNEALSEINPTQIKGLIKSVSSAVYEHDFGKYLRAALLQRNVAVTKLEDNELAEYRRALDFSKSIHPQQNELERETRGRVASRDDNNALKTAMPEKLLGREAEYHALWEYMRSGRIVAGLEPNQNNLDSIVTTQVPPSKASCMLVTGVGGSGKSALLSTFIYKARRWPQNPPIVLIDFDSPVFAENNILDLTFELSRKIGQHFPEIDSEFSKFRSQVRAFQNTSSDRDTLSYEYWQSAHENSMSLLATLIAKHELSQINITLVLDTFEEVLVRGEHMAEPVFRWLDDLKFMVELDNLRVIISGRAAPDTQWSQIGQRFIGHMEIGDLEPIPATMLLVELKVPKATGKSVAKIFGGNPLVLIIFSRFYHENSRAEVDLLLKSGEKNEEKLKGEIAQRFLQHFHLFMRYIQPL